MNEQGAARVLVACECSQVVTNAFRAAGAAAFSCDVKKCAGDHPEWHIQCDVLSILYDDWDLVIAHPPCTYLARVSTVAKSKGLQTYEQMWAAREFFLKFTKLTCPTCIENPIPLRAAELPSPNQWICPSMFGHPYTKKTGLWLYDLPPLMPMTGYYTGVASYCDIVHHGGAARSKFHHGIAQAMAAQWLPLIQRYG